MVYLVCIIIDIWVVIKVLVRTCLLNQIIIVLLNVVIVILIHHHLIVQIILTWKYICWSLKGKIITIYGSKRRLLTRQLII